MEDEEEGREGKRKKVSTSTHLSKSVVGGCSSSSSGISHQLSCGAWTLVITTNKSVQFHCL